MSSIFDQIEEEETRDTVINWENQLRQIRDSYLEHRGVAHGVQKDAIQNGWDARLNQKGTGWKYGFHLTEGKEHTYLVMQDSGTTGLTGRVLDPDEYLEKLPKEERWGRFESLAFTKEEGSEALGSRGQGKFIFVVASKENIILYDTLRDDGSYRLGARTVKKTQSPVVHWDGAEGRQKLQNITRGAIPGLDEVGTRVIIVDPIEELKDALESGEFLRNIEETWWEIIMKYDASIGVRIGPDLEMASMPKGFDLVEEDTENVRYWTVEHTTIEGSIDLKKLHIVHKDPEEVPDDVRGIAIQRGGMKIDTVEPKYLPEYMARGMYGYVTVDEDAELELKRAENPEHYGFNYQYKVPRAIRNFVRDEAQRFASEKLGWNRDERAIQRQRQRNAERKALSQINQVTKDFDFSSPTPGPGPGGKEGTGGTGSGIGGEKTNMLRVQMPDIKLPNPGYRRVNHGETVQNISAGIINETEESANVQLRLYLRYYEEKQKEYHNEEYTVDADSSIDLVGPFEETFDEDTYPNVGKYTFVARVISLEEDDKGDVLDEKRRSFYLEEEPPAEGGIFEDAKAMEYPEDVNHLFGHVRTGEEGGYILEYNAGHPEYDSVSGDEDNLAEYLFRLMGLGLCHVDLERGSPVIFEDTDTDDPAEVASAIFEMVGKFSSEYYSEA